MRLFDIVGQGIMRLFMPLVTCYHLLTGNIFLNTAATDAQGLEDLGNTALIPFQYLFAGYAANPSEDGGCYRYEIRQRFDYQENFLPRTLGAIVALPLSVVAGSLLKGLSYLSLEVQEKHVHIAEVWRGTSVRPNDAYYRSIGIPWEKEQPPERVVSLRFARRQGDENHLKWEKESLREIVRILKKNNLLFWADCGTCLGAYRYGGVIPWDLDIDIAVLAPDFANVKHALNALDREKYLVEDWSNRLQPETLLRVYVRKTCEYIDIYHFGIDPENKEVHFILSSADSLFLPKSWKIREQRYTVPTPFAYIFPLKVADFDGIELPVPNQIKEYLQLRYGDDLSPAKMFNISTNQYEKDLSHPYWRQSDVH